ncbi:nitronate monooxygenase family protein [Sporosarcina sp. Marseille-Q4063]|uniref:NAD(P)H-dependent flavin oxidoreductase n=1 Tax=Sporosarcina sp. Marseille-Q4063 TaxID=2810514 RepID=UPI00201623BF|nr:nitronate monooxygenase [Sporosarcina sp. Marseille-Q4063]
MNFLQMKHPIIQAPMAGVTTPEFVAACSEAGVLGSIGAGYLSAADTRKIIREVKALTEKPFSVNLFIPESTVANEKQLEDAYNALEPIRTELGISSKKPKYSISEFDDQVQVLLEENIKICSFTFGLPDEETVHVLKENGVYLIGTATTVQEAKLAEQAKMDAVVVQGSEAGGHRGSFHGELTFQPLNELLTNCLNAVKIPIIAAGGIANKEMLETALSTGAQAVQIGTALMAANESGAHPIHKQAILHSNKGCTTLTTAFSGKTARGIENRFISDMKNVGIAAYPYQNDLTKEIRKEAGKQGKSDFMSLWAGENVHLTTAGTVEEIIEKFI